MAKNGTDNDSAGGTTTMNGHLSQRDSEVVRLIGQHLEDLGLHKVPEAAPLKLFIFVGCKTSDRRDWNRAGEPTCD